MFQCSEAGIYFVMLTVSTYQGKHCQLNIKKNGKTVASLRDSQAERGGQNMASQSCLLELEATDQLQVTVGANTGIAGNTCVSVSVLQVTN